MHKLIKAVLALALAASCLAAQAGVALQAFEPDNFQRIVDEQKGKPFVLIVWSLDCEYCQASLKTLARERRTRKDLRVVTLATDALGDPQAVALMKQRLNQLGMTANAWAFGAAAPEQLRYAIDPKWHGEMPRSYWFNGRGEKTAYSGVLNAETIARLAAR